MPKTIRKLSKEAEATLIKGLEQAVTFVNDGMHPTDAIYKVASAMSLPAGRVKLMVHGYNNGRTLGQIRNNESVLDKAADFALADAGDILERMFPDTVKTAAAKHNDTAIASDYALPPTYWQRRRSRCEKQAAAKLIKLAVADTPAPYTAYQEQKARNSEATVQRFKKTAEDANHTRINAGYAAMNAMVKLAAYFKTLDCIPFTEVRDNAVMVKGAGAAALFDRLATKQFEKQARDTLTLVDWHSEPYSLVTDCIKSANTYVQAVKAMQAANTEAAVKTAEVRAPFCQPNKHGELTGSVWVDQSPTKEAGVGQIGAGALIGGAAKGLMDNLGPTPVNTLVREQVDALSSPQHETDLQSIRTQTMLNDLMINDPVISGYEPAQVVDAFNHLSQLAPRVAQRRMLAQAMLRKYLEQGGTVDMYDQTQVLGAEKDLGQLENVPYSKTPAGNKEAV